MRNRAAALGLLILLSACFTGQRPTLTSEPFRPGTLTGDPAIDQVLTQLDAVNVGPYTATYTVLTKFGSTTKSAIVAVGPGRRSVTVGDVRFLSGDAGSQTCLLGGADPCSSTIDPARISDTQITPDFYAADAAKRLRRNAVERIGTPVAHTDPIAGQQATCVDVPVPGGTTVFCVLPNGPLARLDDASVSIDLTQYVPTIDESLFATTRP